VLWFGLFEPKKHTMFQAQQFMAMLNFHNFSVYNWDVTCWFVSK